MNLIITLKILSLLRQPSVTPSQLCAALCCVHSHTLSHTVTLWGEVGGPKRSPRPPPLLTIKAGVSVYNFSESMKRNYPSGDETEKEKTAWED